MWHPDLCRHLVKLRKLLLRCQRLMRQQIDTINTPVLKDSIMVPFRTLKPLVLASVDVSVGR